MLNEFFRRSLTTRRIHLSSLDPCNYTPDELRNVVLRAAEAGTDGFLLGGSDGVSRRLVDDLAGTVKSALCETYDDEHRPPLILFPSSAQTGVAHDADGVLFLSLLNTTDVRFLVREQMMAAPELRQLGLRAIGCAMIVIEPGQTVGRVGKAELISRDNVGAVIGYALAAEYFGFPLVYVNAGSGSPTPVHPAMIRAVSDVLTVPLVIGGGLADEQLARAAAESGADVVVTGTVLESGGDVAARIRAIASAVHAIAPKGAA